MSGAVPTAYMMHGRRPQHIIRDDRRHCVRAWWSPALRLPSCEWDIRGGLSWPVPSATGGVEGYAWIVGMPLPVQCGRIYYVLAETAWRCVEHVIDPDTGRVAAEGLAPWFSDAWRVWGCVTWYWHGDRALGWRYYTEIMDSRAVAPKPELVDCAWDGVEYPMSVIRALDAVGRIESPASSRLGPALARWQGVAGGVTAAGASLGPELDAVAAVLVGFEQWPWCDVA